MILAPVLFRNEDGKKGIMNKLVNTIVLFYINDSIKRNKKSFFFKKHVNNHSKMSIFLLRSMFMMKKKYSGTNSVIINVLFYIHKSI